jgi:bacterioferritin-associated ferredoxin
METLVSAYTTVSVITSAKADFWEKCGCGRYCGKPILLAHSLLRES